MQPFDRTGAYTDTEVVNQLTGRNGARVMTYRYDRLNSQNVYLGPIDYVERAEVTNNALADIKRTASFVILDRTDVNYLSDRIRPWCRLKMPAVSTWGVGTAIDLRNRVGNPDAVSGGTAFSVGNATQSYTGSALRLTATGAGGAFGYPQAPAGEGTAPGYTITTGTLYAVRIKVTNPNAFTTYARIGMSFYTAAGIAAVPGSALGGIQTIPAGASVVLELLGTVPAHTSGNPIASTLPILYNYLNLAAGTPAAGTLLDATEWALYSGSTTPTASPLPYVSGNLVDAVYGPDFTYDFAGTVNASPSNRRPLVLNPDTRRGFVEWPLGVFLLATPSRGTDAAGTVSRVVEGYDQLLALRQDTFTDRYSIAAGVAYTTAVATVASGFAVAITPSTATLPTAMEWEPGTSRLRVINDLLGAINYESATFDEFGTLIARPYQPPSERASEYTYAAGAFAVINPAAMQTLDLFDVPNRFVAIKSEADQASIRSVYTNVNPASPTSTVSRGRTITQVYTDVDAVDQATLDAWVARRAFEASQVYEVIEFTTPGMPMHSNADMLTLELPAMAVNGDYVEHSWTLPLVAGGKMSHKVRRVVRV